MKRIKDIVTIIGQYTDKDGTEKNRYKTIGALFETEKGPLLKIDSIPVTKGGWNGWCFLFNPEPFEGHTSPAVSKPQRRMEQYDDPHDDIPF